MQRSLAKDLFSQIDQPVVLRGWLNQLRVMGKIAFMILRDRSGFAQIVIEDQEELQKIASLHPGTVLHVQGKASPSQSVYRVEITSPKITVESPVNQAPEVEYYKPEIPSDLEFILDHRAISLRNRRLAAVFKIQSEIAHAYQLFMHESVGAVEYFSPNMIGASSEGGAEFFNVDYFGYTATLAQSSQLYKQILVGVYERVFSLAPFFRAEPSQTTRHISEGKQLEFEMGFFSRWEEIMDLQEECLKFMIEHLHKKCKEEIDLLGGSLAKAPLNTPFPRISLQKAQEIFFERTQKDERKEPDLSPAAEREICLWAFENYGVDFVFITDWPASKRPFYAFPQKENPSLTNTYDLLCSGTEITSGGQRRHTYASIIEGLREKEMDPEQFSDYLAIFKYGMPPHGGFGMGLERLTMTLLKLKNIREATLFPSDTKRIASTRIKAKIFFGKENVRNEIIRLLKEKKMPFEHQKHSPTPTSEDSAKVRNTDLSQGIKALLLKGKSSKKNYQFNIPSHLKLDMKAVSEAVREKCEFEDPQVILERFGLEIGGIPPFGHLLNVETYYDEKISQESRAAFNCGFTTESIIMNSKDLMELVNPKLGNFTKPV